MIVGSAPAKIILVGEHAVVYGKPAIAVPVSDLRAAARVTPNASPGIGLQIRVVVDVERLLQVRSGVEDDPLAVMARLVLDTLNAEEPNVTLTIDSQIPMASGLGSGAAVSAALGRALAQAVGKELDNETLNRLVYEVEKLHHGTPSGIDNTVVVYEQPVFFVRGEPIVSLCAAAPIQLLIGDTGHSALTKVAVGDVRALYTADPDRIQPILDEIGALVLDARDALERGDPEKLGDVMNRDHELLRRLTVSSPELETLVGAATAAGALGAKLSGGGRGGNMIALVTDETRDRVRHALSRAGAARVFETTIAATME